VRETGATTQRKLPLSQGDILRPLTPKKNRPSFWPSTLFAVSTKPDGAVVPGVPDAESSAWQPLVSRDAVAFDAAAREVDR
jgi:hypothetical protein